MSALADTPLELAAGDYLPWRNALVLAVAQAVAGGNTTVRVGPPASSARCARPTKGRAGGPGGGGAAGLACAVPAREERLILSADLAAFAETPILPGISSVARRVRFWQCPRHFEPGRGRKPVGGKRDRRAWRNPSTEV